MKIFVHFAFAILGFCVTLALGLIVYAQGTKFFDCYVLGFINATILLYGLFNFAQKF